MRAYVHGLIGETLPTVARGRPNTIVKVTGDRALVETKEGHQNYASLTELQNLADRVFDGEEVELRRRGRSAFHAAVLATLPEVAYSLKPRRVWLKAGPAAADAEYRELFPDEDPVTALEGRLVYRSHRARERSTTICRLKKEAALREEGRLACEACGFDYAVQYGELGSGYIECHHRLPLGQGDERETSIEDLALLCASCHQMIHRSKLALSVDDLKAILAG